MICGPYPWPLSEETREIESLASKETVSGSSGLVEYLDGLRPAVLVRIAKHVQGNPIVDMLVGAHAIHRLLHLAVTTITAFYGVGGRGKQLVIQKRQGLFPVGGLKLAQDFSDRLEAADSLT